VWSKKKTTREQKRDEVPMKVNCSEDAMFSPGRASIESSVEDEAKSRLAVADQQRVKMNSDEEV
jgi:hypothetical protein